MKTLTLAKKIEHPECGPGEHRRRRISPPVSPAALDRAVRIFKALGDPPRLRLLAILAQGELCVSEIAEIDDDGLSTVSQRLRVLRSADLAIAAPAHQVRRTQNTQPLRDGGQAIVIDLGDLRNAEFTLSQNGE